VTKNPVLSKIGLGLGLVGGVGALAASALGAASVAADAGSAAAGSAAASDAGSAAASGGVQAVDAAAGGAAGTSGVAETVPDAISSLSAADPAASIAGAVPAGADLAPQDAAALKASTDAAAASGTNSVGLSTAAPNPADAVAPGTSGATPNATLPGTTVPPPSSSGSIFGSTGLSADAAKQAASLPAGVSGPVLGADAVAGEGSSGIAGSLSGLLTFANKNPVVALGALQAGGSLLTGLTSTLTPAQVAALNAQAASNDAAAALTKQQTANLAQPKATASSAPVTGTPQTLVPGGFINQAPPTQPRVTGAPA
jgi:hypothetical protein